MSTKLQNLPVEERIRVVEDIWDSIAADQKAVPLTTDQKAELDRRLDTYEIDKNPGRLAAWPPGCRCRCRGQYQT